MPKLRHWNAYSKKWMSSEEYDRTVELSKKVARLLAENQATVSEAKLALDLAKIAVSSSTVQVQ